MLLLVERNVVPYDGNWGARKLPSLPECQHNRLRYALPSHKQPCTVIRCLHYTSFYYGAPP